MSTVSARQRAGLHPLHAILLAFPIALFSGALASDITYLNSAEMQWSNFSAWMITGALVFGGPVVLWALIGFFRKRSAGLFYLLAVAAMWVIGLVNAFQHSRDAWSSVGTAGLLMSLVCTLLALVAGWIGYSARETVR